MSPINLELRIDAALTARIAELEGDCRRAGEDLRRLEAENARLRESYRLRPVAEYRPEMGRVVWIEVGETTMFLQIPGLTWEVAGE
jgi:predicted nuclease with TOPRIM domain